MWLWVRVRISLYDRGGGGNGPGRTYAMGVVEQELLPSSPNKYPREAGRLWCPGQQRLHHQDCSSASKHAAAARPHAPSYAFCRFCCPGQPLVLAVYQTLHAACSVLGGECNRQAWATRTGLQEPCRDRAFAHRRRKCQRGIRTEK